MEGEAIPENPYPESALERKAIFYFEHAGIDFKVRYQPGIENFINEDGIVQIGSEVFKYLGGGFYKISDGDAEKLHVLDQYPQGDRDLNIAYTQVTLEEVSFSNSGLRLRLTDGFCSNENSGERVEGRGFIAQFRNFNIDSPFLSEVDIRAEFVLQAKNYIRGIFGWQLKRTAALRIEYDNVRLQAGNWIVNQGSGIHNTGGADKQILTKTWRSPTFTITNGNLTLSPLTMTGRVAFFGRNYTSCTLTDQAPPSNVRMTYTPDGANEGEICIAWTPPANGADFYKVYYESVLNSGNFDIVRTTYGTRFCKETRPRYLPNLRFKVSATKNGVESVLIEAI
ncbi:MAG: hypothetical protein AAGA66_07450 [Bacteroidota bacterium]